MTAALFLSGAVVPAGPAAPAAPAALPAGAAADAQRGLSLIRTARDTADPSLLPAAESALSRSLRLQPDDNVAAYTGMASLANARHDFSGSVKWSRRAIAANPYKADAYGLLGDALFELGRVRAADAAYQEMVSRRPDVASYVRASYALQHHGRTDAAISAMRQALRAAGPSGETPAWVHHQMGDIYAGLGRYRRAARENRIGAALAPGYAPTRVGLAESLIARGRIERALPLLESAAAELPSLEYLTTLGDLYAATGRPSEASRTYAEAASLLARYRAAGVLPDADFVVFYADHGLRQRAALAEARAIYRDRPTAKTADALAWALHSGGRETQAWKFAREAVATPPPDAGFLLHAGLIARSLDKHAEARALLREAMEVDPSVAVLQPRATRRLLTRAVG